MKMFNKYEIHDKIKTIIVYFIIGSNNLHFN